MRPLVTGEFKNRTQTAAAAFKPKLWTYAAASPALERVEVPLAVGTDRCVRGFEAPGRDRMAEPGGTIFCELLKWKGRGDANVCHI
jgi:hypothetical protein